ncbi:MAG: hypothetical protein LBU14_04260 [Candidatus Peribacteria bacterium]|nr:hypothetical protein [Candidatus Peribacteria bacterium]
MEQHGHQQIQQQLTTQHHQLQVVIINVIQIIHGIIAYVTKIVAQQLIIDTHYQQQIEE